MKIITLQKNLKAAVHAVNHIAQKNTNLPILNNILISAQEGNIKLISTNLEIGITSLLRGKIESEGSFTVDARLLADYVGLLQNDKVSMELKEGELEVECGENKTKIKGQSAEEFPFIPVVERVNLYTVKADDLRRAISQVVFAAANDEARAELSGVLLVLREKELVMAATDSYRLAERIVGAQGSEPDERRCIVPSRTLQELSRVLGADAGEDESPSEVLLFLSDNQCLFVAGGTEIVSRLIDGRYPDYQQIIPQQFVSRCVVDRQELSRAVKSAAIFSKSGVNDVIFAFNASEKKLGISAASGLAGEHHSTLLVSIEGTDVESTLNSRYILDALSVMNEETVVIEVVDGDTPCILRDGDKKDYFYIIMPIRK